MTKRRNFKSIVSLILAICMMASLIPNVFAAQSNEYTDPAEVWLSSNNRTNELDVNATTTYETQYCLVCDKQTTVLTYRVPEYTRSGETALNRDVRWSDGTKIDGKEGAKEYGVSFGFGLPLFQSKSILNISGQYVKVSPKVSGMLEENTLRVNVGLTFNERWFLKWKVN